MGIRVENLIIIQFSWIYRTYLEWLYRRGAGREPSIVSSQLTIHSLQKLSFYIEKKSYLCSLYPYMMLSCKGLVLCILYE